MMSERDVMLIANRKGRPSGSMLEKAYAQGYLDGSAGNIQIPPALEANIMLGLGFSGLTKETARQVINVIRRAVEMSFPEGNNVGPKCSPEAVEWARKYIERSGNVRTFMPQAVVETDT